MVKKVISFIVILLIFCTTGAAVLVGTSNFGLGFGSTASAAVNTAYSLDRAGDIYYVSKTDNESSLVCLDSSGKRLFEKSLPADIFGERFVCAGIYIEHNKGIYMSAYELDAQSDVVVRASVHSFYEDGTYNAEIFSQNVNTYYNARAHIFSDFSEDDNAVYFAFMGNAKAEVFCVQKSDSSSAAKVAEYALPEDICGAYTFSDGSLALGSNGGITLLSEDGDKHSSISGKVFDRFWNGIGLVYMMDSASGDIYTLSGDLAISPVLAGEKIINAQDGIAAADFTDVCIGMTGNILGRISGQSDSLYYGSFSLMSRIYTDDVDVSAKINSALVIAAVGAAVILLTILTWDFYVGILKMHLSILVRQSLLISLMMSASLYALSYFVISPQVETLVTNNCRHEAQLIANTFEAAMNGAAGGAPQYSDYSEFFADTGRQKAISDNAENPALHLAQRENGALRIIASTELYPAGTPADRLAYGKKLSECAANMTDSEKYCLAQGATGEMLFLIRSISLPISTEDAYLIVSIGVSGLSGQVANIQSGIYLFLAIGGILLVLVLMIIENITAGAVRRLRRSVDKIAAGEYNAAIDIQTGDELEQLSKSVKALSEHIVEKTTNLEKLNNLYYRFVPLSFLKNLGETQIERVNKSLHSKRRMAVMLLRFRLSDAEKIRGSQDIFESINGVFERLIPIVGEYGGTAFSLLYNGCSAIFNTSSDAMRCAVKMRECAAAYNEELALSGGQSADVRIVIGEGDVLLGFVGDEKRMEPTAVSGVFTQAQEIEKLCAESGMYIVCTGAAFGSLPQDKYRSRKIGSFECGGTRTTLYDMFDSDDYAMVKLKEQFSGEFSQAVEYFENGDYFAARSHFMNIVKYVPADGAARNYLFLAEYNLSSARPRLTYRIYDENE